MMVIDKKLYYKCMRQYHYLKAKDALMEAGKHMTELDGKFGVFMDLYSEHVDKIIEYNNKILN